MRLFPRRPPFELLRAGLLAGLAAALLSVAASAVGDDDIEKVIVIGVTPVQGAGISGEDLPGRIQSAGSAQLDRAHNLDVSEFLNYHFGNVTINSAQNNPLQPDVYYRGFAASPLLGLPIGMSVYQNGVRLNEPLGDSVNWELIPHNAIAGIDLIAGSNPLYGLNTLGGSLAIRMKNGFTHPGYRAETYGGSHRRGVVNLGGGGNDGRFGWFVNAQRFYEDGWRDLSDSWVESLYTSFDLHTDNGEFGVNFHRAYSDLQGNGALPAGLLDRDREGIFTGPDITGNDMHMLTLHGSHLFTNGWRVSGNLYRRDNDTSSFNGDSADDDDDDDDGDDGDDDDNKQYDAINNLSSRNQKSQGGALQLNKPLDWLGLRHDFTFGAGYHEGRTGFESQVQQAMLDPDTRSTVDGEARNGDFLPEEAIGLHTRTDTASVYFSDTLYPGERWVLTLSGRYDRTKITLRDQTGEHPELDGEHRFNSFNPALGAVYHWTPQTSFYAGYSQSSRVPTPIELACNEESLAAAEEDAVDCRLPNAFLADPPLDQVTAKSFEAGARGQIERGWSWHLGVFHTVSEDDIIWQTTARSRGLFRNVDETRRAGFEATLAGDYGNLDWSLNYSYLEATFEDAFRAASPNHPNAADLDGDGVAAEIQVSRGDRIPGLPEHTLKVQLDYAFTERLSAAVEMLVNSSQHLRGDESNELDEVSGYAVFNLNTRYVFSEYFDAYLRVENLFDRDYENFGLIGEDPTEVAGLEDISSSNLFFGPGTPIGAWVGLRAKF